MRNLLRAVSAMVLLSVSAHAQPPSVSPDVLKAAEIDLEYDAAKCAMYYKIVYTEAKISGYSGPGIDAQKQTADISVKFVTLIADKIGMSMDALKAQLKMDANEIAAKFGKGMVNAPAVIQKTGLPCKALLEHPEKRLAHWIQVEQSHKGKGAAQSP